jgi:hypothetical protein
MQRYSRRMIIVSVLVIALSAAAFAVQGRSPATVSHDTQRTAVWQALAWLRTQQHDNGSFIAASGHPADVTCDALLALIAAGQNPDSWKTSHHGSQTILQYLAATASDFATNAAASGKLLVSIVAAGHDPSSFASLDLIDTLHSSYANGNFGASATDQAWALIALAAARQPIPGAAVDALKAYQQPQGAWESAPGLGIDTHTTALAIQALAAASVPASDPAIQNALTFYQSQQLDDGGFPYINPNPHGGTITDAHSTAYAIQALIAAGQNPRADPWLESGGDPLSRLLTLQLPDGGFEQQPGSGADISATAQAIPAALGETQPLRLVPYRVVLPLMLWAAMIR